MKMAAKRQYRESLPRARDNPLFKEWENQWSDWILAMSPDTEKSQFSVRRTRTHPNLQGYKIARAQLEKQFTKEAHRFTCGIYQWMASKPAREQEHRGPTSLVVYIGSTCRRHNGESFLNRIMEYCNSGAHKTETIDEALRLRYTLWVSFKGSCQHGGCNGQNSARSDENAALDHYDFAWNVRGQDTGIRNVLQ